MTSLVTRQSNRKQLTLLNVLVLQLGLPCPIHIIVQCVQVYLVLVQTVTGVAVHVCASSQAPYYANSKVGLTKIVITLR